MELAYYILVILYACSSIALSFAVAKLVSLSVCGSGREDLCASADNGGEQKGTNGEEWKLQKRLKVVGLKSLKKRVEAIPSESIVAVDERFGGNLGKADDSFDDHKGLVSAEERIEFPGTEESESCSADDQLLSAVEVGGTEVSGVQEDQDDCFGVDGSVETEVLICERVCEEVGCCSIEGFDKETVSGNDSVEMAVSMNWLSGKDCNEDDVVGKELESCDFDKKEEVGSAGCGNTVEELSEREVGCCPVEVFDKETISGNDSDGLAIWMNWPSRNDCNEDDVVGKKLDNCDFDKTEKVGSAGYGDSIEELSAQEVGCCPIEGFDRETVSRNDVDTLPNWLSRNDCKEDDVVGMELESCDCKENDAVEKGLGSCDHEEDDVVEKELEKLLNALTKIRELLNVVLPSEMEEVSKEISKQHEGIERKVPSDGDNSIDRGLLSGQNGIDNDQHEHQTILESVETDLKEGAQDGYVDHDHLDEEISVSKEEALNKDEEVIIGDEGEGEMEVSDGEEWEGIETSELYRDFAKAANFVECSNEGGQLNKLGSDVIMQFYGLQKVAMEGPCYEPPPMALKLAARAKWNAWRKLGSMNPEEAMENYINLLSDKVPGWMSPSGVEWLSHDDSFVSTSTGSI